MRFFIGIVSGAALTLIAASAIDVPRERALEWLGGRADAVWDRLLAATSDTLFRDDAPTTPQLPSRVTTGDEPALERAEPASTPLHKLDEPRAAAETARPASAARSQVPLGVAAQSEPAAAQEPTADDAESFVPPAPPTSGATADVWLPFHSRMSAQGFAARLSRELDRPFAVEKRGAGAYQVVYSGSSVERSAVLAQVAALTGQRPTPGGAEP